jgi:hypothetical protein
MEGGDKARACHFWNKTIFTGRHATRTHYKFAYMGQPLCSVAYARLHGISRKTLSNYCNQVSNGDLSHGRQQKRSDASTGDSGLSERETHFYTWLTTVFLFDHGDFSPASDMITINQSMRDGLFTRYEQYCEDRVPFGGHVRATKQDHTRVMNRPKVGDLLRSCDKCSDETPRCLYIWGGSVAVCDT